MAAASGGFVNVWDGGMTTSSFFGGSSTGGMMGSTGTLLFVSTITGSFFAGS